MGVAAVPFYHFPLFFAPSLLRHPHFSSLLRGRFHCLHLSAVLFLIFFAPTFASNVVISVLVRVFPSGS